MRAQEIAFRKLAAKCYGHDDAIVKHEINGKPRQLVFTRVQDAYQFEDTLVISIVGSPPRGTFVVQGIDDGAPQSVVYISTNKLKRWRKYSPQNAAEFKVVSDYVQEIWAWQNLCDDEPHLLQLEKDIKGVVRQVGKPFCANALWGREFKPRLSALIGWGRKWDSASGLPDPAYLKDSASYDCAYEYLYELLPDCLSCGCV